MTTKTIKPVQNYIDSALKKIESMDVETARAALATGDFYAVDVREQSELAEQGQLPGAIHLPRGLLEFEVDPKCPFYNKQIKPEMKMLVYCGSGGRSSLAVERLTEMGYDAVNLSGGFKAWVIAGYDISDYKK